MHRSLARKKNVKKFQALKSKLVTPDKKKIEIGHGVIFPTSLKENFFQEIRERC